MLRTLKAVRRLAAGDPRGRWAAFRDGSAAMRVAMVGAGLRTGVLDGLRAGPVTGPDLAASLGYTDVDLLLAYLRVLEAAGLARRAGVAWELTGRGRRLLGDDLVRAAYEGKSSVHTGLYAGLGAQLAGRAAGSR